MESVAEISGTLPILHDPMAGSKKAWVRRYHHPCNSDPSFLTSSFRNEMSPPPSFSGSQLSYALFYSVGFLLAAPLEMAVSSSPPF